MNTTNSNFHERISKILSNENITDKAKSDSIIKILTSTTTEIANLSYENKSEFDEFIGQHLGDDMRALIRKITNNASLVNDDQLFQIISTLTTLHTSAIANITISLGMFTQMTKQREKALQDQRVHYEQMLGEFIGKVGGKLDSGIETFNSNLNTVVDNKVQVLKDTENTTIDGMNKRINTKLIEVKDVLDGARQDVAGTMRELMFSKKEIEKEMLTTLKNDIKREFDNLHRDIKSDFNSLKNDMKLEFDNTRDDIKGDFGEKTSTFFSNLKIGVIAGSFALGVLTLSIGLYINDYKNQPTTSSIEHNVDAQKTKINGG